ncbi:hypothetical protein [Methanococcoides seepicolus]|uniref:Uncharacterized protein n=1 Tax=Methanococcoides seepicolus TaxID=2828780 RepID=A0A9E4ZF30_9EURY|nr:hypothetical protein [Methanococcoides seepicolus]MCM1986467.1 hypothetical protein [Methanococcoides seepicolus]
MQRSNLVVAAVAVVVLFCLVGVGLVYASYSQQEDNLQLRSNFNVSQAVEITMNDSVASDYMSRYFKEPDWRLTRTTFVQETPYDQNGTAMQANNIWKVEIMERSCACQKISDLYVLEGYVSADTGEVLEISKQKVSEREYEKQTCATTVCH